MKPSDKRIEKLLEQGCQSMEDLPVEYDTASVCSYSSEAFNYCEEHNIERRSAAYERAVYGCHLADIIDRMELAMERLIDERDTLLHHIAYNAEAGELCVYCQDKDCTADREPCAGCEHFDRFNYYPWEDDEE